MTSRISLILDPPLPMRDPHCDAGTISLSVTDPVLLDEDPESDLCDPDPDPDGDPECDPDVDPYDVAWRCGRMAMRTAIRIGS